MNKKESISVRLSQEDYQFLMSIDCNGAITQSDKVREVIRLAKEGSQQKSLLQTLQDAEALMRPYRLEQFKNRDSSPFVSNIIDFITEALFHLEQVRTSDDNFAQHIEEKLKPIVQVWVKNSLV